MIRVSVTIAAVALLLSALIHLYGIGWVMAVPAPLPEAEETTPAPASLTFEDLAETQPAEQPEPETWQPVETMETSDARIAASNPQQSRRPDTSAQPTTPEETAQAGSLGEAQEPVPPSGQGGAVENASVTPEVQAETTPKAPQGSPAASTAVPEITAPAPLTQTAVVSPEVIAALPAPKTLGEPVLPPVANAPEPEVTKPEEEPQELTEPGSELAVASSVRPRAPDRRPSEDPAGLEEGTTDPANLLAPPTVPIESPLAAYQRGEPLPIRSSGGNPFAGVGSGGQGNADSTNYAGQVLLHLNRSAAVRIAGRGTARVFFEIKPDGSLAWVNVVDTVGPEELARAAKSQVRAAAPFPRPPDGKARRLSFVYSTD